ncbi:hypothetical protein K493DRAFT_392846, partial [Basidiobolus meristosporus CBS 931.73]
SPCPSFHKRKKGFINLERFSLANSPLSNFTSYPMCSKKASSKILNSQFKLNHFPEDVSKPCPSDSILKTKHAHGSRHLWKQQNSPFSGLATTGGFISSFELTQSIQEESYFREEFHKDIRVLREDFLEFRDNITNMWSHLEGLQEQTIQAKRDVNHRELRIENLEDELRFTTEAVFHVKQELDYLANCQDYCHESLKQSMRIVQHKIIELCDEHCKTNDHIQATNSLYARYECSVENWFDESRRYIQATQLNIRTLTELRLSQDIGKGESNHRHHHLKLLYKLPGPIDTANLPPSNALVSPLEGLLRYYLNATRGLIDIVKLSSYSRLKEEICQVNNSNASFNVWCESNRVQRAINLFTNKSEKMLENRTKRKAKNKQHSEV